MAAIRAGTNLQKGFRFSRAVQTRRRKGISRRATNRRRWRAVSEQDKVKPGPPFAGMPLVILRIPKRDLSFAAKCLYTRLRLYAGLLPDPDKEGVQGPCNPSQSTLGRELGVSDRYIR